MQVEVRCGLCIQVSAAVVWGPAAVRRHQNLFCLKVLQPTSMLSRSYTVISVTTHRWWTKLSCCIWLFDEWWKHTSNSP